MWPLTLWRHNTSWQKSVADMKKGGIYFKKDSFMNTETYSIRYPGSWLWPMKKAPSCNPLMITGLMISICIAPFARGYKEHVAYHYVIVTVISLHLRVLQAKCTPYQHLVCNISHDRYLPDALMSTKQLRRSILPKDANMLALEELELTV